VDSRELPELDPERVALLLPERLEPLRARS
jgi:hypothetical protein